MNWTSIELEDGHPGKGKGKAYQKGNVRVVVLGEVETKGGFVFQMAVQGRENYPTIREIKDAQFMYMPAGVPCYITLPPTGVKAPPSDGFVLWVSCPSKRKIKVVKNMPRPK